MGDDLVGHTSDMIDDLLRLIDQLQFGAGIHLMLDLALALLDLSNVHREFLLFAKKVEDPLFHLFIEGLMNLFDDHSSFFLFGLCDGVYVALYGSDLGEHIFEFVVEDVSFGLNFVIYGTHRCFVSFRSRVLCGLLR